MNKQEFFRILDIAWVCWGGGQGEWRKDMATELLGTNWGGVLTTDMVTWAREWAKERCAAYPEKWYDDFDKGGYCQHCGVHESEHK